MENYINIVNKSPDNKAERKRTKQMKKHKKLQAKRRKFMAHCRRSGSYCFNPLCALGCVK